MEFISFLYIFKDYSINFLAVIGKSTKIDLTKIGYLCLVCLGV